MCCRRRVNRADLPPLTQNLQSWRSCARNNSLLSGGLFFFSFLFTMQSDAGPPSQGHEKVRVVVQRNRLDPSYHAGGPELMDLLAFCPPLRAEAVYPP